MDIWYQLVKTILRTYATAFIKGIEVDGAENLVAGPKIIAANHANATDCFTLPLIMKEKLHFLVQAESFTVPILGKLLSRADQIPVVRRQGYGALKIAEDRLAQGNSIVIFPEGKLNHGRDFHRPRVGAVLLSMLTNVPITPVGFYVPSENTRTFLGRFHDREAIARWQCRGKCFVQIGQPYHLGIYPGNESDYQLLRKLTSQLMEKINVLVQKANESAQLSINLQLPDLNLEAH
jgi:1-acyl-sn-glycerol-3-phosphate acyltransferase